MSRRSTWIAATFALLLAGGTMAQAPSEPPPSRQVVADAEINMPAKLAVAEGLSTLDDRPSNDSPPLESFEEFVRFLERSNAPDEGLGQVGPNGMVPLTAGCESTCTGYCQQGGCCWCFCGGDIFCVWQCCHDAPQT
jgi:hypothetical protein